MIIINGGALILLCHFINIFYYNAICIYKCKNKWYNINMICIVQFYNDYILILKEVLTMTVKDFAREADIKCEEAKEILEEKFDIIPLTDNYILPEEVAEKIQKDFINDKENLLKTLASIYDDEYVPIKMQIANSAVISRFLDRNFSIFIDSNFIFGKNFVNFVSSIENVLKVNGAKLMILDDVEQEIKKHTKKSKIKKLAKSRLGILNKYIEKGILQIAKEEDIKKICKDNFADFTFQMVFQVYRRNNKNVMLITNDKNLTTDILMLNLISSVDSTAEMCVGRIDDTGLLIMQKLKLKNSQKT